MGKMVVKDTFREIKNSFGRFFAIFAIVAIGVAFFAGVTASSEDMKHSSDCYYDEYNLMDLRILSGVGFTDEDIDAIRNTEGVEGLFATHTIDAVTKIDGTQSTVRVMTVPDDNLTDDNKDYINRLRIKEGRLPEKEGECVIRYSEFYQEKIEIGDVITLSSGNDSDISDSLKTDEYEVVGIVYTPYYVSYDIGQSDVGNGSVGFCIMVTDSSFAQEYYTEVFATVEGAKELDTYSDEYFDLVGETKERIEDAAEERLDARVQSVKDDIESERRKTIDEIYENVRTEVREQLYEQYSMYYPGIDVSSMIEPQIESIVQENINNLDLTEINEQFDRAEEEAIENGDWQWYVLDRNSHYSFRDYESSADRMNAIAVVFPMFFILVAALVCLTTMTRMVDEQRGLIGTYKALGYGKTAIAMKFVLYSFIASITGGILGCIVGLRLFPAIIYDCWNIIYYMPAIQYADHWLLSIIAIVSLVLVIVAATVAACVNELAEVPSQLMRPKSPKKGKKIFLEHIGFIWKRLSFSGKVTARNIFRYKKRFLMTVVGIAGGCALMFAGFGIKDSISALIEKQYNEIIQYDVSIKYEGDEIPETVNSDSRFEKALTICEYTSDVGNAETIDDADKQQREDVSIEVVEDAQAFKDYVLLRKRNTDTIYELDDEGVCITEQLAGDLNVKAGDTVYITGESGQRKPVRISHVVEMYTSSNIFMTSEYYESVFGEDYEPNCILGILVDSSEASENQIGEEYLLMSGVRGMTFFTANIEKFNNMISSLNLVTYVLILSAAALTFVVLYNLTNVNVSERIREIATIKVLGFFDAEVASYVYRENVAISVIGSAAGLVLGVFLHRYIMKTVEMDNVMFGNAVEPLSFVYAFVLTMVFSLIVNLVMYRKLKNIPMVESLKSVE